MELCHWQHSPWRSPQPTACQFPSRGAASIEQGRAVVRDPAAGELQAVSCAVAGGWDARHGQLGGCGACLPSGQAMAMDAARVCLLVPSGQACLQPTVVHLVSMALHGLNEYLVVSILTCIPLSCAQSPPEHVRSLLDCEEPSLHRARTALPHGPV
jgi:hypothetical protein